MKHCTICGAASREGAKFCTSCGARLEDEAVTAYTATDDTEPDAQSGNAGTGTETLSSASEQEHVAGSEPPVDASVDDEASTSRGYTASWPDADSQTTTGAATASFATDAEQDLASASFDVTSSRRSSTSDAEEDGPRISDTSTDDDAQPDATLGWSSTSAASTDSDLGDVPSGTEQEATSETFADLEDHIGASHWESWSPDPSPQAMAPHSDAEDSIGSISRLMDELQQQVERLRTSDALTASGINPDDLARQLDRWSSNTPDIESLLAVVQRVRKHPRDLDAIGELTDNVADLELVVRHYQSITSQAASWAATLNRTGAYETDG